MGQQIDLVEDVDINFRVELSQTPVLTVVKATNIGSCKEGRYQSEEHYIVYV